MRIKLSEKLAEVKSLTSIILQTSVLAAVVVGVPFFVGAGVGGIIKHFNFGSYAGCKGAVVTGGLAVILGTVDMAHEIRKRGSASLSPAIFPVSPIWAFVGGVAANAMASALSHM